MLPQLAWNASHTGDPLAVVAYIASHSDKDVVFRLDPTWWTTGLLGLLASPARGLVFFAPIVLVELYAGLSRGDVRARVIAAAVIVHVAIVAAYRQWWGGWAFGPRMLSETVWLGALLVPLDRSSRLSRALLGAAAIATAGVGLLGTFRFELGAWDLRRDPDLHHDALWDLLDSPLVAIVRGHATPTIDAPKGPYAYCVDRAIVSLRPRNDAR
jgi:hypothetical protein